MAKATTIPRILWLSGAALLWFQTALTPMAAAGEPKPAPGKPADREMWARKLAGLKEANWRVAFEVGQELADLPAEEGFAILKDNWEKIVQVDARQQFLKAWYWGPGMNGPRHHPRLLDVLDLAVRDRSPAVQSWALNFLSYVAFQEFAEDFQAYKAWYRANRDKPIAKVIEESARRLVVEADKAKGKEALKQAHLLSEYAHKFSDVPAARKAAEDAGLLKILERWAASTERDERPPGRSLAGEALRIIGKLKPGEAYLRRVVVPLLAKDKPSELRGEAVSALGDKENAWALDLLLDVLKGSVVEKKRSSTTIIWGTAGALAEIGDPRAIPVMIGVIDADNTYDTVYGVGYFGLGKLTGVRYDEAHNGAWWRQWWQKNKERFPTARGLEIPKLTREAKGKTAPPVKVADVPLDRAEGDASRLIEALKKSLEEDEERFSHTVSDAARALEKTDDPRAIPVMIGVIDADNTYATIYGVGYFGLGRMTGVRYDESHGGAWWRQWWEKNKERFPTAGDLEIPRLTKKLKPRS